MATSGIDATTTTAILTAMHGGAAVTFATPIKLLFLSTVRTLDNNTGTVDVEIPASAGYVQGTGFSGLTFAAAASGNPSSQASSVAAVINNAAATTWSGCKEVDSSGTPKTLFWAALGTAKTVNAGDTLTVPSGSLTDSLG